MNRWCSTLLCILVASMIGCAVRTSDGIRVWKGSSEDEVIAKLGEPDMTVRSPKATRHILFVGFRTKPETTLYYFDRMNLLVIRDGGLFFINTIQPRDLADLKRQQGVYQKIVPLVRPDSSIADVEAELGEPQMIEENWQEEGKWHHSRRLSRLELQYMTSTPENLTFFYPEKDVFVVFAGGRVSRAEPIPLLGWQQWFGQNPPTLGSQSGSPEQ